MDSFSAHETDEFFDLARKNNVDIVIIPVGVHLINKPFKTVLRKKRVEYMDSLVSESNPLKKLTPPDKPDDPFADNDDDEEDDEDNEVEDDHDEDNEDQVEDDD